uniref:Uncharacterized protein n=1 Tax=Cacopsylla melanoneura TaxID=428564 RepID=A0A8D8U0K9_9HEMI
MWMAISACLKRFANKDVCQCRNISKLVSYKIQLVSRKMISLGNLHQRNLADVNFPCITSSILYTREKLPCPLLPYNIRRLEQFIHFSSHVGKQKWCRIILVYGIVVNFNR